MPPGPKAPHTNDVHSNDVGPSGDGPKPDSQALRERNQQASDASKFSAAPKPPVSLSNAGYNHDLWQKSPFLRNAQRALDGWVRPKAPPRPAVPPGPPQPPTQHRPGRDGFRAALRLLLAQMGPVQERPALYVLAGPLSEVKPTLAQRLFEVGALPAHLARADVDQLCALIPEHSEVVSRGGSTAEAMALVRGEAQGIADAVLAQALNERRDVLYGSERVSEALEKARATQTKRLVLAFSETPEVTSQRAAMGPMALDPLAVATIRPFAQSFDTLVSACDELVLALDLGPNCRVVGHAISGRFSPIDAAAYQRFRT